MTLREARQYAYNKYSELKNIDKKESEWYKQIYTWLSELEILRENKKSTDTTLDFIFGGSSKNSKESYCTEILTVEEIDALLKAISNGSND